MEQEENLSKRQKYYFLGREKREQGLYQEAIAAFEEYSRWLAAKDKHIPYLWISELQKLIGQTEAALESLEKFARGCQPARSADLFKEIGLAHEERNETEKAIIAYEKAIALNSKIGLNNKLAALKAKNKL